jgi:hypothetical protein
MKLKRYLCVFALHVVLVAVLSTLIPGIGHAMQQAQPQATNSTPDKVWIKDPGKVMPMRKMTNADRRKAAARMAARRSRAQRHLNAPLPQGVQR